MPTKERLDAWWGKQLLYRMSVGIAPVGNTELYVHLYQLDEGLHIGTYASLFEAKLAAWTHSQQVEKYETAPEIRDFLIRVERELLVKLGKSTLTKRQVDVLGMMYSITQDAIAGQIWKVQK